MDEQKMAAKDDMTLLVRQLHPKTGEFDVFELFSTAGKVVDVRLIMDERTGKCQGVGYVEMCAPPVVPRCRAAHVARPAAQVCAHR